MHEYRIEFVIKSPVSIRKSLDKVVETMLSIFADAGLVVYAFITEEK